MRVAQDSAKCESSSAPASFGDYSEVDMLGSTKRVVQNRQHWSEEEPRLTNMKRINGLRLSGGLGCLSRLSRTRMSQARGSKLLQIESRPLL